MPISHQAITSPIFELKRTVEFDITLSEDFFPVRIEVFQDIANPNQFRCRIWQLEYYRVQPTFPQDGDGNPSEEGADEAIWVDWEYQLANDYQCFTAQDTDAALTKILDDVRKFLLRTTGS